MHLRKAFDCFVVRYLFHFIQTVRDLPALCTEVDTGAAIAERGTAVPKAAAFALVLFRSAADSISRDIGDSAIIKSCLAAGAAIGSRVSTVAYTTAVPAIDFLVILHGLVSIGRLLSPFISFPCICSMTNWQHVSWRSGSVITINSHNECRRRI